MASLPTQLVRTGLLPLRTLPSLLVIGALTAGGLLACGGTGTDQGSTTVQVAQARPGGDIDLVSLVPSNAVVALRIDMNVVRTDPARYQRFVDGLTSELGLTAERGLVQGLLARTSSAVGTFLPSSPGTAHEGVIFFAGAYTDVDFASMIEAAQTRHGGPGAENPAAPGRRVLSFGNASLAQLDTWTWAISVGPNANAHLLRVALQGGRFSQNLAEFGPRIGLPNGSSQAWADQSAPVGADMVGLVFQGETPRMVQNFVTTVGRHLGI